MTLEQQWVRDFGVKGRELGALHALAGGVTASHLRTTRLSPGAFDAVIEGLQDPNPKVRWWCIQVLDHVPDERAVNAIAALLDDPVPRVRRNAAHALGCVACKPEWSAGLTLDLIARLTDLFTNDPNHKVRHEAAISLSRGAS